MTCDWCVLQSSEVFSLALQGRLWTTWHLSTKCFKHYMFISFYDSFKTHSEWYKLCPRMSLFRLVAQKWCEPRVMWKQFLSVLEMCKSFNHWTNLLHQKWKNQTIHYHFPVLFRYHTNIEFFLKKEMSNCFSAGISQCAAVEHHLPSPRVAETIDQSTFQASPWGPHDTWLHQNDAMVKTMTTTADTSYSYFAAVAWNCWPYSTRDKKLELENCHMTSTFGEANTFCTASKKQAIHSHGHWLIDLVFCRSIGASSARGATVSPPPQPILFVLSRIKHNCTTSRDCQIRWPGVCFKGLFRSMLRASLSSERQKPESLSGVCFAESPSPKSKIPALLKVGTLAKKMQTHTLPETNSLPLKICDWKTTFLLGRPIFRGYVSF